MNEMKGFSFKWLWVSAVLPFFLLSGGKTEAQNYTDSLTFKIDSAKIEGDFLIYSVMFWRNNDDWRGGTSTQDTILGNTDLYFWLEDVVFDKTTAPAILRKHPNLDVAGGFNLLDIEARYYAYRFSIKIKPKENPSSLMPTVPVKWKEPQELCRVKLRMTNPSQNPNLRWDTKATGGQSTIGEPLILTLDGDILLNPDQDIILVDNSHVERVCEGGEAKIWAKGYSQGTQLKIAWYMSDKPDCIDQYNAGNGVKFYSNVTGNLVSGQLHVADVAHTAKWGDLAYHITCANDALSRVDTLHVFNVPISMDSVYFQCELSDDGLTSAPRVSSNTPGGTDNQKTQVLVRDSLHGWFAAADQSMRDDNNIGASDRTDTVMKCPSSGAVLSFYFFGPECDEDHDVIGAYMDVTYQWQDALGGGDIGTYRVNSWSKVTGETDPLGLGKCLYKATVVAADSITDKLIWVKSIATAAGCNNGGSYRKYDTLYIRDLPQDQTLVATITDTTLSAGETMALRPGFDDYYILNTPALGSINKSVYTYKAPATSCSNPGNGCRDTIVYKYTKNTGEGTGCQMEFHQVVNLNDVYYLSVKVLLEGGFLLSGSNNMYSDLSFVFPLAASGSGHYESPYSHESCASLPNIGGKIVDWILIELREASNIGNAFVAVDTAVGFLREDGMVYNMEGKPYVTFENLTGNNYHVIVEHRNHIGSMSKNPVTLKTSPTDAEASIMADFSNAAFHYVNLLLSIPPYVVLSNGLVALHVGDVDKDGMIAAGDANAAMLNGSIGIYSVYDVNFDVDANAADYNIIRAKTISGNPMQHY